MDKKPAIGSVVWRDLTVENADQTKDFYTKVVGWKAAPHSMGDYNDYNISDKDGNVIAGICNKRGTNSEVPPQWLVYIQVENVEQSAKDCLELGGKILDGPRKMGENNFCIIEDLTGAVLGLIQ